MEVAFISICEEDQRTRSQLRYQERKSQRETERWREQEVTWCVPTKSGVEGEEPSPIQRIANDEDQHDDDNDDIRKGNTDVHLGLE